MILQKEEVVERKKQLLRVSPLQHVEKEGRVSHFSESIFRIPYRSCSASENILCLFSTCVFSSSVLRIFPDQEVIGGKFYLPCCVVGVNRQSWMHLEEGRHDFLLLRRNEFDDHATTFQ